MNEGWHAGAARVTFPVPVGSALAGYAARDGRATTILDELEIGALVLERERDRLTLVTADVIGIDADLTTEVAAAGKLDPDRLVLAASHTHSGPAGIVGRLHPGAKDHADAALRAAFVGACGEAIREATAALAPATLWLGRAEASGVCANRNAADGPRDDRVTTIAVRDERGETRAVFVQFACHPTILGAESLGVSADLVGGMRRALANSFSDTKPVVLFGNGAAGDVSTRFTRRHQTYEEVERLGGLLADAAGRSLATATPLDGPLRRTTTTVSLPRKADPGPDAPAEALRLRAEAERVLASDAPETTKRQELTRAQGAELAATLAGATEIPEIATLSAWALGDLAFVTVPGELFARLGREIEAESPIRMTILLGYANGHVGYLADAEAESARTYEALASPYTVAAGRAIVRAAVQALQTLHGNEIA